MFIQTFKTSIKHNFAFILMQQHINVSKIFKSFLFLKSLFNLLFKSLYRVLFLFLLSMLVNELDNFFSLFFLKFKFHLFSKCFEPNISIDFVIFFPIRQIINEKLNNVRHLSCMEQMRLKCFRIDKWEFIFFELIDWKVGMKWNLFKT